VLPVRAAGHRAQEVPGKITPDPRPPHFCRSSNPMLTTPFNAARIALQPMHFQRCDKRLMVPNKSVQDCTSQSSCVPCRIRVDFIHRINAAGKSFDGNTGRGSNVNVNCIGQALVLIGSKRNRATMARGLESSLTEQRVGSIFQNPHRYVGLSPGRQSAWRFGGSKCVSQL